MIFQVLKEVTDFTRYAQPSHYEYSYCEFCEDSLIEYDVESIEENDGVFSYIPKENSMEPSKIVLFNPWVYVMPEYIDINDKRYVQLELKRTTLCYRILIRKKDKNAITKIFKEINGNKQQEQQKGLLCIDKRVLDMAENLLNIADEGIMLNSRILLYGNATYYLDSYIRVKTQLYKSTCGIKCKERKEVEKFNNDLEKSLEDFSKIIDNFVELIIEEKQIKEYIAKRVAWIAIQIKTIEYYSQLWKDVYDIQLKTSFDDLYQQMNGQSEEAIKKTYIKSVIACEEIEIAEIIQILIYFLLSKDNLGHKSIYDYYINYKKLIEEVKSNVNSSDIKSKLKSKQTRKICKYTIDDIDLMNGTEFEEFVGILFKNMGYSTQVTKKSGDQGLDVIAIKNGKKIGIQAKCYSTVVGNSAVQEAAAGKNFYNCDNVLVITNNYFTTSAIELAQANGVTLWNRDMLIIKLKELN